ncbi:ribosomal protein [Aureococcus anophagefferens]|nr:ribosomal protein [Aureococcus anophagefferens]
MKAPVSSRCRWKAVPSRRGFKMGGKTLQNSRPKKYGKGGRRCRVCGNQGGGMIRKYNMNICRQCFRQYAADIGFQKYN